MFCLYGLWRPEAWDRYFYNEAYYEGYSKEDIKDAVMNPFAGINLSTEDGKRLFEDEVKRFMRLYPGAATKPGEEFNFQKFYATWDLINGKDLTKYESGFIEEIKTELKEKAKSRSDSKGNNLGKKFGLKPDFTKVLKGYYN